jgi:VanZ family protein
MKIKLEKISLIIFILCASAITICSLLPNLPTPEKYNLDKFMHGAAYAGLIFLAYCFVKNRKIFISLFICVVALGGIIEIIQTFIPTRSGTIGDFAADLIGAFFGALIAKKLKPMLVRWFK